MADDPYTVLGVPRTATADEIRRAFRAIAKKNHPDLNPGNAEAESRFKAANAANELLSDADKRARFDRGEIDGAGQEAPPQRAYREYAGARHGASGGFDAGDLNDIFGEYFQQGGGTRPRRGADRSYRLVVPFLSAVNGATERLTLPAGETLDVRIPPGIEDGQSLRLRAKGDPGRNGGPDGDALIQVAVEAHPVFAREGRDIELDLPVTLAEAVLGAKVPVPTPRGEVTLSVPAQSDAGTRLRLRGRGVAGQGATPAGDLYVRLTLIAGPSDPAFEDALRDWSARHEGFDPRAAIRVQA